MSKPRPAVMLVGPWPPTRGGVTTFMLNVERSALARHYEIVRFTTSRPPKRNVTGNWGYGALLQGGPLRMLAGIAVTAWHLAVFPFRVLGGRVDLVQVQASDFLVFWEAALYVAMARLLGRPVALRLGGSFDQFHAASGPLARRLIGLVLRLPQRLIVQSDYWRRFVAGLGREAGVQVVGNWMPAPPPAAGERPATNAPVFLFIAGSEATQKGVNELLQALAALRETGPALRVRMLATPPVLADRVRSLGLGDMVACLGTLARGEVLQEMAAADVFLIPSRGEGFPNSLLEAMACGLPAVASMVGAVPEVVADGETGRLIPPRDAGALAEAMRELADDAEQRRRMGAAARRHVAERYSEAAMLPALEAVWRDLLPAGTV